MEINQDLQVLEIPKSLNLKMEQTRDPNFSNNTGKEAMFLHIKIDMKLNTQDPLPQEVLSNLGEEIMVIHHFKLIILDHRPRIIQVLK